jgi:hypothetical protein
MGTTKVNTVNARWIVAAAVLAAGSTAYAQETPPVQQPRAQSAPTLTVRFPPVAPDTSAPERQPVAEASPSQAQEVAVRRTPVDPRRDDVHMMESVLTQALQKGAQDLARQLKVSEPNSAFVTSTGRARGFALDGYGMFFDVDVPGMKQSVVWSAQMLELAQQRDQLRQFLVENPTHPARRLAEANLRQIERMMLGLTSAPLALPSAPVQAAARGMAVAQSMAETVSVPSAAAAPIQDVRDPNELYTDSVKNALIDAMLKYSGFLKIKDNEWLTVAASDSDGPQTPGQLDEALSIVIRVKGSDLAAFQSNKLTREEVLKRVEVREF